MILMLLVQEPHFENGCSKRLLNSRGLTSTLKKCFPFSPSIERQSIGPSLALHASATTALFLTLDYAK